MAGWFGLATGLLDAMTCLLLRGRPGFAIRVPNEILWISPAFHVLLFLLMTVGLVVLFALLRRRLPLAAVAGVLGGVGVFSYLLRVAKFPQIAAIILSVGVGVQIGRMLRHREDRWLPFLRRSFVLLFGGVFLLGTGSILWAGWRERDMVRALPPPPTNAPNVLLITLDTLRADHLSSYGYARKTTPNLDRLAERGVLFEFAFANSSWTLPAHASLLTGRLPSEHGADWRSPMDAGIPTLAETFSAAGYRTGGFVANNLYLGQEWGLARGFSRYEAHGSALLDDLQRTVLGTKMLKVILPRLGYLDIPGRKRAGTVNQEFFDWLDGFQGWPFFAFLNYLDVHDPYVTLDPYHSKFSSDVTHGEAINFQFQAHAFRRKHDLSSQDVTREINGYDGCLAYLDAEVGALLSELERRGLAKNTLVIVTSDHGEAFGNHDLFGHGNSLYLETLHVPLILVWPGKVPAGARIPQVVGLEQIPATVQELLALPGENFSGDSLSKLWFGTEQSPGGATVVSEISQLKEGRPTYPTWSSGWKSLVTPDWHFLLSDSGGTELYAWREDPKELRNLVETEEGRATVKQLQAQLAAVRRKR